MSAHDAWRLQQQAETLIDTGRYDQAIELLTRASAAEPEAPGPHALRAFAFIQLERWADAEQAAGTAASLAPETAHVQRLLAIAQLKRGHKADAKATALRAVGLDAEDALNYVILAETLHATRDQAGALAAAEHAIALDPEASTGYDTLGRLLLAYEDPQGAEEAFRAALALDPEDEGIMNNLALSLSIQGRDAEAVAGMEAATRLDPADALVRRNVLLVARDSHGRIGRGIGMAIGVLGVIVMAIGLISQEDVAASLLSGVVLLGVGVFVFDLGVRYARAKLPEPTATLVWDDHAARRLRPWRWDWTVVTRLRPWWWFLLERIPPPVALVVNIAAGVVLPVLLLGVPFSAWRAWKWYRRQNPGKGSWKPPAG